MSDMDNSSPCHGENFTKRTNGHLTNSLSRSYCPPCSPEGTRRFPHHGPSDRSSAHHASFTQLCLYHFTVIFDLRTRFPVLSLNYISCDLL
ncbi:uncharacterized protein CYBJADRAFT_51782 [Cyberlindnera jadinii NRRL Y-1542]|uniref:Uncharacterized protein n=1 Tax=Cyberlindnera jadinii (strain ATCC 18201 / CBS 1600 / BCRC 20928 / JCM 3617 / NBRC 0987 / NRRL Y-1542) TaxID=983966 RepID=A0A1E4RV40_CYBJN|nr:hypothetical protein CYBJADRAFT_51782 [Cyberlindnera jadinii NRRL Y-1542]ODV71116.1 hypothetical protein CYBJADRAFT_51782 [Cyberlindnera jadinii NRRL Y-1542]